MVAPELVSRDLRGGVLPLYFSRPLRRTDYALAKLAALITAVLLLLAGPQLLMFLGGAFTDRTALSGAWNEFADFLAGLGYAASTRSSSARSPLLVASLPAGGRSPRR